MQHVSGVSVDWLMNRGHPSRFRDRRDLVGTHVRTTNKRTALNTKNSPESLREVNLLRLEVVGTARGWLCGDGNEAAYGPCVASAYHRLDVVGPPSATDGGVLLHPGLLFTVSVSKLDTYGQVCQLACARTI